MNFTGWTSSQAETTFNQSSPSRRALCSRKVTGCSVRRGTEIQRKKQNTEATLEFGKSHTLTSNALCVKKLKTPTPSVSKTAPNYVDKIVANRVSSFFGSSSQDESIQELNTSDMDETFEREYLRNVTKTMQISRTHMKDSTAFQYQVKIYKLHQKKGACEIVKDAIQKTLKTRFTYTVMDTEAFTDPPSELENCMNKELPSSVNPAKSGIMESTGNHRGRTVKRKHKIKKAPPARKLKKFAKCVQKFNKQSDAQFATLAFL